MFLSQRSEPVADERVLHDREPVYYATSRKSLCKWNTFCSAFEQSSQSLQLSMGATGRVGK